MASSGTEVDDAAAGLLRPDDLKLSENKEETRDSEDDDDDEEEPVDTTPNTEGVKLPVNEESNGEIQGNGTDAAGSESPRPPSTSNPPQSPVQKKKPEDFVFLKIIGEGSFSTVHKVQEKATEQVFAVKMCEKAFIVRNKKTQYILREKDITAKLNHPFCIGLYYTFQDPERLYFALTYCPNGDLLEHIRKLGNFNIECTQFYTSEIVVALEHLQKIGIIHRDLKPENILLGDDWHIRLTDFGSAKDMSKPPEPSPAPKTSDSELQPPTADRPRRNSFVGTAQYVSPEILESGPPTYSSDLWALGCIIYQLHTGIMPFDPKKERTHEFEIFQNIINVRYTFTEDFDPDIRDVVEKLIVKDPDSRLGCKVHGGISHLKQHHFFTGVRFGELHTLQPPTLGKLQESQSIADLISEYEVGMTNEVMTRLIENRLKQELGSLTALDKADSNSEGAAEMATTTLTHPAAVTIKDMLKMSSVERSQVLEAQKSSVYHEFAKDQVILKQGILYKRKPPKGMAWKKRMFLLIEGPRLLYIDPRTRVVKGEMTWSREVRPEAKNFRYFFIHSRGRTYELRAPKSDAPSWCDSIQDVWTHYYGPTHT